jgi:antitoxin VapB
MNVINTTDPAELAEKTGRLERMLTERGLDAVLLNAQHNFAWLTGGRSNGVDLSRAEGVASLLVTRAGKRFLLSNNIEMPRMLAEEVDAKDFEPIEFAWTGEVSSPGQVMGLARTIADSALVAADLEAYGESIEPAIAGCRYSLTPAEIARYRTVGRDAAVAVQQTIGAITPGMSELEIAAEVQHGLAVNDLASVVNLVAADERIAQFRHPIPTAKKWEKLLMIVVCAKRHGLIANLTRILCEGSVPDGLRKRTEAAAYVNARLWDATRVGQSGAELFTVAADAYGAKGYDNEIHLHHQGGATGYRTRDWTAHPQRGDLVVPHQAFAWNPSITGTKVEETGILGEGGLESITVTPELPQIEVSVNGRLYSSPDILTL